MVTEINESKTLTKYVLCKCKLNLMMENVIPMKSGRTINVECKNRKEHHVCKKLIFEILLHLVAKMINI